MGYWYVRAKITNVESGGLFKEDKKTSRIVEGKIISTGEIGVGSLLSTGVHPYYLVVTKEGENPMLEAISAKNTDICEILELTYKEK
jgi:hypothetical protein